MKEKISAIPCLKCGEVLATLKEMGPEVSGIDKDAHNRFLADERGNRYIVCKFCGAKNGLISFRSKTGLLQFKLDHLIE
ncbi:MAG: hypothetical protein HQ569_05970 [Actinobacteria bacterium]|nr:hypothetical protein [Actinomycetota bacterium]